eukprot:TRINITY_DN57515_c0_g1_i1.p1 TRINITY_DN57515_c0_g1~~TRINITY_DN57515_c0_g1_i1.p1  ORF type:complete len:428 (+),score=143.30 TRINITY_DN57515_c0_g1_i1:92-1375(+)
MYYGAISSRLFFFFFFSSRRRHTRCREVSWARRCVQETGINAEYMGTHGFPSVMGVLTHLDHYKLNKQQKKMKKRMKKRFWKEVYDGAKLFYLSGLKYDMYKKNEIHNLARFISIIKVPNLEWKSHHPYIFADRFDIAPAIVGEENTMVSFYGYVRGTTFNENNKVHIIGLGDYGIKSVANLTDPCPSLQEEKKIQDGEKKKKKRTLNRKERLLYAPMSNLDFASIDHSNGFITIPDKYVFYTEMAGVKKQYGGEAQEMMQKLQNIGTTVDRQLEGGEEAPEFIEGLKMIKEARVEEEIEEKMEEIKIPDIIPEDYQETMAQLLTKEIYDSTDTEIYIDFPDCSRFVNTELKTQEEYLKLAKNKFITSGNPLNESDDRISVEQEESEDEAEADQEEEKKFVDVESPEIKREEYDSKVKKKKKKKRSQ